MELERKARSACVSLLGPDLIRGFDAMHVRSNEGPLYWLVSADAAVPFRTSIMTVETYDARSVLAALEADFERNGAPLVLRLDRIACQRTREVEQLLERYGVLALHGPPRHPQYYGQLERQNREHRAWYDSLGVVSRAELERAADEMKTVLNTMWRRPTLDWCTAEQAWMQGQRVDVDREELRRNVDARAAGLQQAGLECLHARRIAIEIELTERGLLTVNLGARC